MTRKTRQPLFAQSDPEHLPHHHVKGEDSGDPYKTDNIPHPFSYVFLAQNTPSPAPDLHSLQSVPKSTYHEGLTKSAIEPANFLSEYYKYLHEVLLLITNRYDGWQADTNKSAYEALPTYDDLYRAATTEKTTDLVLHAYQMRYRSSDANFDPQNTKSFEITSLVQSFLFLQEITGLILSRIRQEISFDRYEKNIRKLLNPSDYYDVRTAIEFYLTKTEFQGNVAFNSGNSPLDRLIPEHVIVESHINQALKIFFLRRLIKIEVHGDYLTGKNSTNESLKINTMNHLIEYIGKTDLHGVKAGIQDEVKHAHKSHYAPHELLFID